MSGDEQDAVITVRPKSSEDGPDTAASSLNLGSRTELEALQALLRLDGGELCLEKSKVTLRFASLSRARAEGR